MWRDVKQIDHAIKQNSEDYRSRLETLVALSSFVAGAIPTREYTSPPQIADAIALTIHGKEVAALVKSKSGALDDSALCFALLADLFHHDLHVDPVATNMETLQLTISNEIRSGRLRLPYRFGRSLYDKFHDDDRISLTDHLSAEEVDYLLEGSEQGVFQIGTLVTGPLGILDSQEGRFFAPVRALPLWHCHDTGCRHVHVVELLVHKHAGEIALETLRGNAKPALGPHSEWSLPLARLHRRNSASSGRNYYDLAAVIGDAIVGEERDNLLQIALNKPVGKRLRTALAAVPGKLGAGSPADISGRLTDASRLQLLMTLQDSELIEFIDEAVRLRAIDIPSSETRRSRARPKKMSAFDRPSRISMFGIRTDATNPPLLLSSEIWNAYAGSDQLPDLAWRCGEDTDTPHQGIVLEYIKKNGVRDAVRKLIISSRHACAYVADKMLVTVMNNESEEQNIDRIMWKFGFEPPRYDRKYDRFRQQLAKFREELLRHQNHLSDDDRASIRNAGANVFVSLEDVLEEIIAFNLWLLSSDHFVKTKFRYRRNDARACVLTLLANPAPSAHVPPWHTEGGNTLGPLLYYARAAADWMRERLDDDRASVLRPAGEVPHYANDPERPFSFMHLALWADTAPSKLSDFTSLFDQLVSQLEQSKLAEVRNGLNHYREEKKFPTLDVMLACESRLSADLEFADVHRFVPKTFWAESANRDNNGLGTVVLHDYRGRSITVSEPSSISGLPRASFANGYVVPHGNLMGWPNSELLFSVREESRHTDLWSNYPRHTAAADNLSGPKTETLEAEDSPTQ